MVAGRAELSRSLFVARIHDVIGCGIGATFVSTRKSGGKSRHFLSGLRLDKCRKKENKKYLKKKMSERGSLEFGGERENVLKDQREGKLRRKRQGVAVKRSSEQREERLTAKRKWAVFERSNESSEQREERLEAQRKRAAFKRSNESSKEREERLRTERERAAAKRARETSQEKELRLRARRERAALKRQNKSPLGGVETNRRPQSRRVSDNRRRNQREAIFAARRNGYLHNRGWADPENRGLHHEEWAQEEMAAFHRFEENLRNYHCVVCKEETAKKHGRCLLPERRYILARDARQTRSRVDYILLNNDMDPGSVPAELQGLSEVEELLIARAFPIMSIYRKHGGQRGYNGNVLNLPEDTQGFLNSLPPNVGGLPILVIRKQGAGKCL